MKKSRDAAAFYVEALILVLVLLCCLGVLVRLFGAARRMSLRARQQTAAVQIAQNISADFLAGSEPFADAQTAAQSGGMPAPLSYLCGADGVPTKAGEYQAEVSFDRTPTRTGSLLQATITILHAEGGDTLTDLTVEKYIADDLAN
jgi:predicted lipid-binding transport protein (Tim44 family)